MIKDLQKKAYSELTSSEKEVLRKYEAKEVDENGDEIKPKPDEETPEGDEEETEELDEKAIKSLVGDAVKEAIEKKVDGIAEGLIKKFQDGIKTNRSKIHSEKTVDEKKGDMNTREFMKALGSKDKEILQKYVDTSETGAAAGYTIPEELLAEVLRIAEDQYGLARRDMFNLPFSGPGNTRKIPTLSSALSVVWTDEAESKTSKQPTFSVVTQTLKKLAVIIPFTEEILEDSAINLTQLVATLVAEAISKEEDNQFFAGTGSPWTGVLNTAGVNTVTMGTGDTAFTNVDADDLLDMQDSTPSGALAGAKYYMHRTVYNVIRKLKTDDGAYLVTKPTDGAPAMLWNYPIELSDAFPSVSETAEDTAFILFSNLKKSCIFGDKQQIRVKMLDQATITDTDGETSINLAEQDMVAMRFVERVGFVVGLATAITVLKTNTTASA